MLRRMETLCQIMLKRQRMETWSSQRMVVRQRRSVNMTMMRRAHWRRTTSPARYSMAYMANRCSFPALHVPGTATFLPLTH